VPNTLYITIITVTGEVKDAIHLLGVFQHIALLFISRFIEERLGDAVWYK
jgi:hypothetical protein